MLKVAFRVLTIISLFTLISFAFFDIYTEAKMQGLIDIIIKYYEPFQYIKENTETKKSEYDNKIQPIDLFDILYANIFNQKPEEWKEDWIAGYGTPGEYRTSWRNVVIKNPEYIYNAWDLYGESALMSLNSKLGYNANLKTNEENNFQRHKFTTTEFLRVQKEHLKKYINLCDQLLKLDDKNLNYFMRSVKNHDDALCYDFNSWLVSKGMIQTHPQEQEYPGWKTPSANNGTVFPGDLILLTTRLSNEFPEWGIRKFLQEYRKFSMKVLTTTQQLYP